MSRLRSDTIRRFIRQAEESPFVKEAMREALDDLRHKRAVTLQDYLRGKRTP